MVGMLLVGASLILTTGTAAGAPPNAPMSVTDSQATAPADCLHVGWSGCMIRSTDSATRKVRIYQPADESLYRYYSNYLIPCLRAAGVETAPLPSRSVVDRRLAEGYPVWLAYDRNAMIHRGEVPEDNPRTNSTSFRHWLSLLLRKCPPLPPP